MRFAKSAAGILWCASVSAAVCQAPVAPTAPNEVAPFTGLHTTDSAAHIGSEASIELPTGTDASCACLRYIDVEFVSLKQTSPANKQLLVTLQQSDNGGPQFVADEYRTGTVNTHFAPGVKLKVGQWVSDCQAVEAGLFVLDEFFYNREYLAVTSSGGTFGGQTSFTVTYVPNNRSLDWTQIYNVVEHWGLETNIRRKLVDNCNLTATSILGLRYHQIHERYNMDIAPVRTQGFNESFDSGNDIFGVQLGGQADWKLNRFVSVRGKAAYVAGFNFQWDSIKRNAVNTGFLTGPNNLGYHDELRFGNFIDLSLGVAAKLTPCIETSIGYAFMGFGGVKRSATMLDLNNIGNPNYNSGQDSMFLYGLTVSCKVDY